jgi:hypothetical protein
MSDHLYLLSILSLFGSVVGIFGMKYYFTAQRTRAQAAEDATYQALAEKAAFAQSEAAAALKSIQGAVLEISARLTTVEKILKDVG